MALLLPLLPLLPTPASAGWADVAFRLPGEVELQPDFRPVALTPEQVARMRRRALLQALAEDEGSGVAGAAGSEFPTTGSSAAPASQQLPVCELNLGYRIVDVGASNFTSIVTLTNNREVRGGAGCTAQQRRRGQLCQCIIHLRALHTSGSWHAMHGSQAGFSH